jgi:hypothetical protein
MPEESSFYIRLPPGLADLGWETFLQVLARSRRVQRQAVACALGVHVCQRARCEGRRCEDAFDIRRKQRQKESKVYP